MERLLCRNYDFTIVSTAIDAASQQECEDCGNGLDIGRLSVKSQKRVCGNATLNRSGALETAIGKHPAALRSPIGRLSVTSQNRIYDNTTASEGAAADPDFDEPATPVPGRPKNCILLRDPRPCSFAASHAKIADAKAGRSSPTAAGLKS